jgi:hypothetical protein
MKTLQENNVDDTIFISESEYKELNQIKERFQAIEKFFENYDIVRLKDGSITIVDSDYLNKLKDDSLLLGTLEGCGVDNWEGWDDAYSTFKSLKNGNSDED